MAEATGWQFLSIPGTKRKDDQRGFRHYAARSTANPRYFLMKKALIRLVLVALGIFAAWTYSTYPRIGEIALDHGSRAEAAVYGLQTTTISIEDASGNWEIAAFQGGDPKNPAIVLVHGFTADKTAWMRFAKYLTDAYYVVVPDLPGHGDTGYRAGADYAVPTQAARIALILDALNVDKAHVAGNSMGGAITASFAIQYPERTLTAAMFDPAGVASPEPSEMQLMLEAGRNPFLVTNRQEFKEFFPMTMAKAPWLPGFVTDAIGQRYIERRERHADIFEQINRSGALSGQLERIQSPALLIWGREDRLIHVSSTVVWAAEVPQLELEVYDEIGHMPMLEIPAQTAERYRQFLGAAG